MTSSKESWYSEIDGMTEENSSSRARKLSLSSSVYSWESEEDLKEGSTPEPGTIEPCEPLASDSADTIVPSRRLRSNKTAQIVSFISYTTL